MIKVLSDKIKEHILSNLVSYIVLICLFIFGIAGGAYIYNCYSQDEIGVLTGFFSDAKEIYLKTEGVNLSIFKNSLFSSFKTVFLIWLLGFTVIGIPIVFFTVIKKGFIFGLITNFLITNFSNGIILTSILFFIQSLILVPSIFVISTYSISLSKTLIGMVTGKIRFKVNLKYYILYYFIILFAVLFVSVLYALSEAYFSGNLLKWFIGLNS